MPDPSIARFRRVVTSAYANLEERRQEVNDLNVFPVADGDTGDNMAMTMRAVMEELDRLDGLEVDEVRRTQLVQALARATRVRPDRKSTRLNSSHTVISYAVFCLKKKNTIRPNRTRRHRGYGRHTFGSWCQHQIGRLPPARYLPPTSGRTHAHRVRHSRHLVPRPR